MREAVALGRNFIGCEIDEDDHEAATKRTYAFYEKLISDSNFYCFIVSDKLILPSRVVDSSDEENTEDKIHIPDSNIPQEHLDFAEGNMDSVEIAQALAKKQGLGISASNVHGMGVYAARDFKEGIFQLLTSTGEVITAYYGQFHNITTKEVTALAKKSDSAFRFKEKINNLVRFL